MTISPYPVLTWIAADGSEHVLDCDTDLTQLLGATGLDVMPFEWSLQGIVSGDGVMVAQGRKGARPVTIPLKILSEVMGPSRKLAEFASALHAPGTLECEYDGTAKQLREVIYTSGLEGDTSLTLWRDPGAWTRVPALGLLATDPWWYGDAETVEVPLNAATAFDAAIPFDDPDTSFDGESAINFTVTGDADALAVVTIMGPFDSLRVTLSGGTFLELAAPLASGNVITVDSRPGRRGPRLNGGAIDWSLLTDESRLLRLPQGGATLSAGFAGDDATSSIEVWFEPRSLTPW